ncbi:putative adhesin [Anabaena azotica]|uniref:Putative adhesin Stv domain-containing protein n=1 Tax=Anabaena azotica FACHB-119 TaxID=947527 RepID=A0ABR8CWS0_9NOST|nr:hypothetical protein [Anabaena azotica]MBD2499262.1 hypothetical protein [Anabaena azotica FACHB-119]
MATTVNFHFHCLTDQIGDRRCLLFLQPVDSDSDKAKNYQYSSWQHFQPSQYSHNTITLQTVYSAGVAIYPTSSFHEFTDPIGLDLGKARKVINTHGSDPHFSGDVTSISPEIVGVYNACTDTQEMSLSVIWYVNKNKVVETNNTDDTKLLVNDTSTFQLKQTLYATLATYDSEETYNLQTFSKMFSFAFNNNDTDLYFEIDYQAGLIIRQTNQVKFAKSFVRSSRLSTALPLIKATKDDFVCSGHGAMPQKNIGKEIRVPDGVRLVVLAPPAASVSNDLCQGVESGNAIPGLKILSPTTGDYSPTQPVTYEAGSSCPNYSLYPIDGSWLKPGLPHLITVENETSLQDLWSRITPFTKPGKIINVYWAACTALSGAKNQVVVST